MMMIIIMISFPSGPRFYGIPTILDVTTNCTIELTVIIMTISVFHWSNNYTNNKIIKSTVPKFDWLLSTVVFFLSMVLSLMFIRNLKKCFLWIGYYIFYSYDFSIFYLFLNSVLFKYDTHWHLYYAIIGLNP